MNCKEERGGGGERSFEWKLKRDNARSSLEGPRETVIAPLVINARVSSPIDFQLRNTSLGSFASRTVVSVQLGYCPASVYTLLRECCTR